MVVTIDCDVRLEKGNVGGRCSVRAQTGSCVQN